MLMRLCCCVHALHKRKRLKKKIERKNLQPIRRLLNCIVFWVCLKEEKKRCYSFFFGGSIFLCARLCYCCCHSVDRLVSYVKCVQFFFLQHVCPWCRTNKNLWKEHTEQSVCMLNRKNGYGSLHVCKHILL